VKKRYQLMIRKCLKPKKTSRQKKFYPKYKPGDRVELYRMKMLDYNGKMAIVVGPIIKGRTLDGKNDRYPVKLIGANEPDRVFNVKHYNMFLKEIQSRMFRKLEESKKAMELEVDGEAVANEEVKKNMDVAGKDVDMTGCAAKEVTTGRREVTAAPEVLEEFPEFKRIPPPERTIVGTVVDDDGAVEKIKGKPRRSKKRKRGKGSDDEADDPDDPRPKKKFQLTYCRILSDIYTSFTQLQLARLSRFTLECRDCQVHYPISWGMSEPHYFNVRLMNERNGPRSCMVCQTRKNNGYAYRLFARMCRIDTQWVKRQEEFQEKKLYWNVPKLCDAFEKQWKEVQALEL